MDIVLMNLYINASEDIKNQIDDLLKECESQPEFQEKPCQTSQ